MNIDNLRGELTDISAKKEALLLRQLGGVQGILESAPWMKLPPWIVAGLLGDEPLSQPVTAPVTAPLVSTSLAAAQQTNNAAQLLRALIASSRLLDAKALVEAQLDECVSLFQPIHRPFHPGNYVQ